MCTRLITIILTLVFASVYVGKAQDSISYSKDFRLYEGIYLSYEDFRYNWPIPKEKIITKLNKEQLDFFSKLLEEDEIEYVERDSSIRTIQSERIWGYCQNNVIFINYDKTFYRIPVFGAISHFLGTVEVMNYSNSFDPFMNAPMNNTTIRTREIRQFLFDFYSGDLTEFSISQVEDYLKRDAVLYNQFSKLSKRKKKKEVFKYIRLYNDAHPVYFPKN